jgi:hypothetical protein
MFPETVFLLASEPHQVPGNEKSQIPHEKLNHQGIILSDMPSSIIGTLVSIPPCYTNHFSKEYNMKLLEPKNLNYTNLNLQHSHVTEESRGTNSCMSNQSSMTIKEACVMKLVLV